MPAAHAIAPTPEARAQAKRNPNGWVYVIQGEFGPNDTVPPEAIAGAWQVDATGHIIEDSYVANPDFAARP
jgi:hypothetical protein